MNDAAAVAAHVAVDVTVVTVTVTVVVVLTAQQQATGSLAPAWLSGPHTLPWLLTKGLSHSTEPFWHAWPPARKERQGSRLKSKTCALSREMPGAGRSLVLPGWTFVHGPGADFQEPRLWPPARHTFPDCSFLSTATQQPQ